CQLPFPLSFHSLPWPTCAPKGLQFNPCRRRGSPLKRCLLPLVLVTFWMTSLALWAQEELPAPKLQPSELQRFQQAANRPEIKADSAWMLVSTALVMLMVPGLALFYGGMVRRKNILATMMQSMVALAVVGVYWVAL